MSEQTNPEQAPVVDTRTLEEKIQAALTEGASDLEKLASLKALIDANLSAVKAAERERTEKAKAERRAGLMAAVGGRILDAAGVLFDADFLAGAKDAGLLGVTISFPQGEGASIGVAPVATRVATVSTERKTAPDGSTPVKASPGTSAEPGDEATYNSVTTEEQRAEDAAEIQTQIAAAVAKGRPEGSAKNSITWKIRHDRIKTVRTGTPVGHLKK